MSVCVRGIEDVDIHVHAFFKEPQSLRVPVGSVGNWLQVIAGSLSAHRKWCTNLGVRNGFKQQGGRLHNAQMGLGHVCVMRVFIKALRCSVIGRDS